MALFTLMERLSRWAWKAYSSLCKEDREDLVASLGEVMIKAILKSNAIDYWEITFAVNRDRAAADIYQKHFVDRYRNAHEVYDADEYGEDDGGFQATEIAEMALIEKHWANVLTSEEMNYLRLLFLSGLALNSPRATSDLVRITGKAEGTLREIKTNLKKKLKAALEPST